MFRKIFIGSMALIGLLCLWFGVGFWSLVEDENDELHSVIIKAKIVDDQYRVSNSEYKVSFLYNKAHYINSFQAGSHFYKLNDSVSIKIDSRNPLKYCELFD